MIYRFVLAVVFCLTITSNFLIVFGQAPRRPWILTQKDTPPPLTRIQYLHQQAFKTIHIPELQEAVSHINHRRRVLVFVVDTNMNIHHEALEAHMWHNTRPNTLRDVEGRMIFDDVHGYNFCKNSASVDDGKQSHATLVAGIIAAIAPEASIVSVVELDDRGKGDEVQSIKALTYVAEVAEHEQVPCIVNLSSVFEADGAITNQRYLRLLERLQRDHVLLVVSAGNDKKDITRSGYILSTLGLANEYALVVAGLSADCSEISSNYSPTLVDIAAPGTDIITTSLDGGYTRADGSSIAVPMVVGILANLLSDPSVMSLEARECVVQSAQRLPNLEGKLKTNGRVDALAAWQMRQKLR